MRARTAIAAAVALLALIFAGTAAVRLFAVAGETEASQAAAPRAQATGEAGKRALVVYYSYTGNTRALAEQIGRSFGGDLFELQPVTPYASDYDTVVAQGKREVEAGYRPSLQAMPPHLAEYDIVFVGTPIWWYTIAPPIATFLAEANLVGKTVVPFCTHGGYGAGRSLEDVKRLAPHSRVVEQLSLRGGDSYEQQDISAWLEKTGIAR